MVLRRRQEMKLHRPSYILHLLGNKIVSHLRLFGKIVFQLPVKIVALLMYGISVHSRDRCLFYPRGGENFEKHQTGIIDNLRIPGSKAGEINHVICLRCLLHIGGRDTFCPRPALHLMEAPHIATEYIVRLKIIGAEIHRDRDGILPPALGQHGISIIRQRMSGR